MIEFQQAQKKLHTFCQNWLNNKPAKTKKVSINDCLNTFTAEAIYAHVDLPYENMSAMDGYALCFHDQSNLARQHQTFSIIGESRAGQPFTNTLSPGECIRIMTGAVVPASAHTVVMQENITLNKPEITLLSNIPINKNIRLKGEEIQQEQLLFLPGSHICPNVIGVLASQGISHVHIYQPLKIGFFSSGDELRTAEETLNSGDIFESNLSTISALLKPLPVELYNLGIIPDKKEVIETTLKQASEQYDIVISSGSVSVGDYDFIRGCVAKLGHIEHYKVAIKPGKPVCFGQLNNSSNSACLFFGLPGNPVSAFVTLQEFFIPAIWQLSSYKTAPKKLRLTATLENAIKKRVGRMEFQRGILSSEQDKTGHISWKVKSLCSQDSHRIYNLSQANCYIVLSQEADNMLTGDAVTVEPFPWSFNA